MNRCLQSESLSHMVVPAMFATSFVLMSIYTDDELKGFSGAFLFLSVFIISLLYLGYRHRQVYTDGARDGIMRELHGLSIGQERIYFIGASTLSLVLMMTSQCILTALVNPNSGGISGLILVGYGPFVMLIEVMKLEEAYSLGRDAGRDLVRSTRAPIS